MSKQTPLYEKHLEAGARMVDFGGWSMPLHYGSQLDEHHLVRKDAGMFDVSHMTVVDVQGAGARDYLRFLLANDVAKLKTPGKALYSCMLTPEGGVVDDLITYYLSDTFYRVVVNAATRDKDLAWMRERATGFDVVLQERDDLAMVAVQGPNARDKALSVMEGDLAKAADTLSPFMGAQAGDWFVGRTGYTGEDGFEILCPAEGALALWSGLLTLAEDAGGGPIGLGARDTLRLEARLCLYGNDIDESTNPYEAGLGWVVKLDAGDFIGREALIAARAAGPARKLVGFRIEGRGIARPGYPIVDREREPAEIGRVTSGTTGITVGGAIGMGYVPADRARAGETITIDIRGKDVEATLIKGPFYKREA
jgi:aminomethyltransferase